MTLRFGTQPNGHVRPKRAAPDDGAAASPRRERLNTTPLLARPHVNDLTVVGVRYAPAEAGASPGKGEGRRPLLVFPDGGRPGADDAITRVLDACLMHSV